MDYYDAIQKRKKQIERWRKTEKHAEICYSLQQETTRLIDIGIDLYNRLQHIESNALCFTSIIENEVGGYSNLHRGFYCPSPVFDLVIGNVRRGRILKRPNKSSKFTHRFGFSETGDLLFCETILNGNVVFTEYIIYQCNSIYGITVTSDYTLAKVSEECYHDGKLLHYSFADILPEQEGIVCFNYHKELYTYDSIGLKSCVWKSFMPYTKTFEEELYVFEREEGFLVSYTAIDRSVQDGIADNVLIGTYRPGLKRKA